MDANLFLKCPPHVSLIGDFSTLHQGYLPRPGCLVQQQAAPHHRAEGGQVPDPLSWVGQWYSWAAMGVVRPWRPELVRRLAEARQNTFSPSSVRGSFCSSQAAHSRRCRQGTGPPPVWSLRPAFAGHRSFAHPWPPGPGRWCPVLWTGLRTNASDRLYIGQGKVVLPVCFVFEHLAWQRPNIAGAARVGDTRNGGNDYAHRANLVSIRSLAAGR